MTSRDQIRISLSASNLARPTEILKAEKIAATIEKCLPAKDGKETYSYKGIGGKRVWLACVVCNLEV